MVTNSAWPMCSEPVTFGGGMTIEKGALGDLRVGVEVALLEPEAVPPLLDLRWIVGFGQLVHRSVGLGRQGVGRRDARAYFWRSATRRSSCSRMIVSASSGTTSQAIRSITSRETLAIASYSGPRAVRSATARSATALTIDAGAAMGGGGKRRCRRRRRGSRAPTGRGRRRRRAHRRRPGRSRPGQRRRQRHGARRQVRRIHRRNPHQGRARLRRAGASAGLQRRRHRHAWDHRRARHLRHRVRHRQCPRQTAPALATTGGGGAGGERRRRAVSAHARRSAEAVRAGSGRRTVRQRRRGHPHHGARQRRRRRRLGAGGGGGAGGGAADASPAPASARSSPAPRSRSRGCRPCAPAAVATDRPAPSRRPRRDGAPFLRDGVGDLVDQRLRLERLDHVAVGARLRCRAPSS